MKRAIGVQFPTGKIDVGWGQNLGEAAHYAFEARARPWCVQPEREEIALLREKLRSRYGSRVR